MSDPFGLSLNTAPTQLSSSSKDPEQAVAEAEAVAEEFESLVLSLLLSPMFNSLETDGLGGGGTGERAFRPLIVEEYAKGVSQAGGIGVADAVMRELLRAQGLDTDGQPIARPTMTEPMTGSER